jgi:hypothetical protein
MYTQRFVAASAACVNRSAVSCVGPREMQKRRSTMNVRTLSWALLAGAGLLGGATALPAAAAVRVGIGIHAAPPAPRVVVVPAARRGYVWAPGYWRWNGKRHVWVEGRYLRERRGYAWVADRWEDRRGDWHYVRGHWERH